MAPTSDSDEDSDYVPPEDEEPETKRARTDPHIEPEAEATKDEEAEKRARDALWAEFQASVSTPLRRPHEQGPPRMVKIEKRYRFAGEDVIEVKEVAEDSEEAKKWPHWQPPEDSDGAKVQQGAPSHIAESKASSSASSASATPVSATNISKPAAKRPGPRKPKTILAPPPGTQKAKKLTTLDKSAMDWRAHVQTDDSAGLKDELEANRRGGGYLEKVEFLQRVEERKADALDASKSKRRRE